MTLPKYIASNELEIVDPTTNKPVVVVRKEPVRAEAPNRGTYALSEALDALQMHSRLHQTLHFKTTPSMKWSRAPRRWQLSGPLTLSYVLDYPGEDTPAARETTLLPGNYVFPAGKTLMLVPLGTTSNVTLSPSGAVPGPAPAPTLPPGGTPPFYYLAGAAELTAQLRLLSEQGRDASLRYVVLAQMSGTALLVLSRHVLRDEVSVTNGYEDSEYQGIQLEQELSSAINRDRNILILGGGEITCSPSGASNVVVATSLPLRVMSPRGVLHTISDLQSSKTLTPASPNLVLDLSPTAGPASVAATTSVVPDSDVRRTQPQRVLLARLDASSGTRRVVWRDGSVYGMHDSYPLGMRPFRSPEQMATDLVPFYVFDTAQEVLDEPSISPGDRRIVAIRSGQNNSDPRIRFTSREILDEGLAVREILHVGGVEAEGESVFQGKTEFEDDVDVDGVVRAENAEISEDLDVGGDAVVHGDLEVHGDSQLQDVTVGGPLSPKTLTAYGTVGTSTVAGSGTRFRGDRLVVWTGTDPLPTPDPGSGVLALDLAVGRDLSVGRHLSVTEDLSVGEELSAGNANLTQAQVGTLTSSGNVTVGGTLFGTQSRLTRVHGNNVADAVLRLKVEELSSVLGTDGIRAALAPSVLPLLTAQAVSPGGINIRISAGVGVNQTAFTTLDSWHVVAQPVPSDLATPLRAVVSGSTSPGLGIVEFSVLTYDGPTLTDADVVFVTLTYLGNLYD